MEKKCFKCKRKKPLEQFYKHPATSDGHLGKCKACTKKDVKERYNDPEARERIRKYEAERFKKPERKAKTLEYNRARAKRNPGKAAARRKVTNALKYGRLERKPCEVCGDQKSEGHHTDYRKALDVKWLCFKHHREEHGQKVG